MESFLASVERRAFRMAEIGTGNSEEALDIVQEAMFGFVQKYSNKPDEEWRPLFFRILQNKIRDWHRRAKVRKGLGLFWPFKENERSIQELQDTKEKNVLEAWNPPTPSMLCMLPSTLFPFASNRLFYYAHGKNLV